MGPPVIIFVSLLMCIFGIAYLFFSTRNKERMALIEKGVDASLFIRGKNHPSPVWKIIILNLALLLIGIGAGILIAGIVVSVYGVDADIAFPGALFLTPGIAVLIGYFLSRKLY